MMLKTKKKIKAATRLFRRLLKRAGNRIAIDFKFFFFRKKKRPFIILTMARCGSNLLLCCLDSLPGVSAKYEVLDKGIRQSFGLNPRSVSKRQILTQVHKILNFFKDEVCGSKIRFQQLKCDSIDIEDLRTLDRDIKFIILYRKSIARQLVSLKVAAVTGKWVVFNKYSKDFVEEPIKISLDRSEMRKYFSGTRKLYENILSNSNIRTKFVAVSYEELVEDVDKIFQEKICPFLGIPFSKPEIRTVKLNQFPLSEIVSNYDEVKDLLESELAFQEYNLEER